MAIKNKLNICVVGSVMTDLVMRTPRFPSPGETLIGTSFQTGFGGKGSNQAVMAARLGADVTMVARIGDDSFGKNTLTNFRENGIDPSFVFTDPMMPSGVAQIWVDESTGQNSIVIVPGANMFLTPNDIQGIRGVITESQVVVTQLEISVETTAAALKLAKEGSGKTILNPAPATELSRDIFKNVDICVPNESEAKVLTGIGVKDEDSAFKAAENIQQLGAGIVIITLGNLGAFWLTEKSRGMVSANLVKAVDSTGAGDAFVGTLAVEIAKGKSVPEAVRSACDIASDTVTREGTQTSFPSKETVARIISD